MKLLFIIPYPLKESPSQRFRFEQYLDVLRMKGHQIVCQSFLDEKGWQVFSKRGNEALKLFLVFKGLVRRTILLFRVPAFDIVFIHREAAPLGPPVFEWIISRLLRKKIVYDFDDAIWLTDRPSETWWLRLIKARGKVRLICKWSYKVSCGNEYLCQFARKFADRVTLNPTTIDTLHLHNRVHRPTGMGLTSVGWTGSHSSLKYLALLENVFRRLQVARPDILVTVIADQPPGMDSLSTFRFVRWTAATEIEDLLTIDIGLMPLPDDAWSLGKCGFKALQYMSLGIPALVSPVGVNAEIVEDGVNGYHCVTDDDWLRRIEELTTNPELREAMGARGREKVVNAYSVSSNTSNFCSLFE